MTEQVKLSELVEDLDIYPRGSISEVRVGDLVYALDAGDVLPPPDIDRATRKIADGFHRIRAYRRRLGDDGMIGVNVHDFADAKEMLLFSVRVNSLHGMPLGRYDQRVTYLRAQQLGASDEETASALRITPARLLQAVTIRIATSDAGPVALKRGTEHLGGSYLTTEQVAEIRRQRGAPARAKVNEVTRLLQQSLAPVERDPELRAALAVLAAVIEGVLAPYTVAE